MNFQVLAFFFQRLVLISIIRSKSCVGKNSLLFLIMVVQIQIQIQHLQVFLPSSANILGLASKARNKGFHKVWLFFLSMWTSSAPASVSDLRVSATRILGLPRRRGNFSRAEFLLCIYTSSRLDSTLRRW